MNEKLKTMAYNSGIRFDSFDVPVVDRMSYLEAFAKEILQLASATQPKDSASAQAILDVLK